MSFPSAGCNQLFSEWHRGGAGERPEEPLSESGLGSLASWMSRSLVPHPHLHSASVGVPPLCLSCHSVILSHS